MCFNLRKVSLIRLQVVQNGRAYTKEAAHSVSEPKKKKTSSRGAVTQRRNFVNSSKGSGQCWRE